MTQHSSQGILLFFNNTEFKNILVHSFYRENALLTEDTFIEVSMVKNNSFFNTNVKNAWRNQWFLWKIKCNKVVLKYLKLKEEIMYSTTEYTEDIFFFQDF